MVVYQLTFFDVQRLAELMVLVSFMCGALGVVVMRFLCGFIALLGNAMNRRQRIREARERAAARAADGRACETGSSPCSDAPQPISQA